MLHLARKRKKVSRSSKLFKSFWDFFKQGYRYTSYPNRFDEIQREAYGMNVSQEKFDGAKFDISKTIAQGENHFFAVGHSFLLGSKEDPAAYSFSATYGGSKLYLNGRVWSNFKVLGRGHYQINKKLSMRFLAQSASEPDHSGWTSDIEYRGHNYNTYFKVGLPFMFNIAYHQNITRKLSLGCETLYQNVSRLSSLNLGARYEGGKYIASAVMSSDLDVSLAYTKILTPKLGVSTEFMYNIQSNASASAVSVEYKPSRKGYTNIRVTVDSSGCIYGIYEDSITNGSGIVFACEIDHIRNIYSIGIGVSS